MDRNCPNFARHSQHKSPCNFPYHPISQKLLLSFLFNAVKAGRFVPLHNTKGWEKEGDKPFPVFSVAEYECGYAVAAKGAEIDGPDETSERALLAHAMAFQQLRDLQGKNVPVCIGMIDVPEVSGLETIGSMLFYSWPGFTRSHEWKQHHAHRIRAALSGIRRHNVSGYVVSKDIRYDPVTGLGVFAFENANGPFLQEASEETLSKYHPIWGFVLARYPLSTSNADEAEYYSAAYFDP